MELNQANLGFPITSTIGHARARRGFAFSPASVELDKRWASIPSSLSEDWDSMLGSVQTSHVVRGWQAKSGRDDSKGPIRKWIWTAESPDSALWAGVAGPRTHRVRPDHRTTPFNPKNGHPSFEACLFLCKLVSGDHLWLVEFPAASAEARSGTRPHPRPGDVPGPVTFDGDNVTACHMILTVRSLLRLWGVILWGGENRGD